MTTGPIDGDLPASLTKICISYEKARETGHGRLIFRNGWVIACGLVWCSGLLRLHVTSVRNRRGQPRKSQPPSPFFQAIFAFCHRRVIKFADTESQIYCEADDDNSDLGRNPSSVFFISFNLIAEITCVMMSYAH